MSDTRARINKLRQIRRQMEKEIRMVEAEAARREKRRSQQRERSPQLNRAKKRRQQEDVSLVNNRVMITKGKSADQECKFFILTRNLILAASNRQLKSAFSLWRRKAGLERPKKAAKRTGFVSNIPTRRRVTKREETSSSEDTSLSDTETRESRYSPSPIHTSILKSSNPRAVWKNLLETPDERKVTITVGSKPTTPVSFSHDGTVMVTPGGTSSSDPEFTFTPQPGTPVVRQVLDTPVGVRVSDALNRSRRDTSISGDFSHKGSKKVAINIGKKRDSGSSDVDEFLELENQAEQKTSTSESHSEPEEEMPEPQMSPIPAPYPDEMIEDEDSFVVSAIAATPKQVSYIENSSDDDEISDGYIEESFSRQTSPKSVVKKNFSGSLRDKLDNDTKARSLPSPKERKRKESVVRDLSGFEELSGISSGSPHKQALTSSAGLATPKQSPPKYTFRPTQGNEDSLSTPVRKAKLAEILEYVESLGNEQDVPASSFSDLSKSLPSPSIKELSLDIGDIAVERTTPYTLRQGRSPPRLLQSDSPRSSPTPVHDDTIVQEIPSPYIVKRGDYLCQLVHESPKETLYLNDDGIAREEPTEYSITKGSTPRRSFISDSPRQPEPASPDTSQSDEPGVSRYIDDSSADETSSPTPPTEPSRRSDSENDSALRPEIQKYLRPSNELQDLLSADESTILAADHPHQDTASEEDYDDELDMKSYNNLMNLDLSSSGSGSPFSSGIESFTRNGT